jgi:predicted branched-subunit amino acid permease
MEDQVSSSVIDLAPPGPRAELRAGVRAMAPMILAYLPFALMVGAAVAASANPLAAWLATWTIYGGAAHLAVLDVLAQGSGWLAAAAVGLLVNARLTAYATAMAPQWRSAPFRQRAAAGLMLTDAPWALARESQHGRRHFYLGAAGTLFLAWPAMVTLGVLAGNWVYRFPAADLLPALTLGALVMPQLRQRPSAAAAAAASVSAVLTSQLPAGVSLGFAAAVGAIAGVLAERAR